MAERKRKKKSVGNSDLNDLNQNRATSREVDVDPTPSEKKQSDAEGFLNAARDLFHAIADDPNETRIRSEALEDLKFYNNDQWPEDTKNRLQARRRPVLTINRVKPACRQVINSLLQDRPSIKFNPADDKADVRTAQILDGVRRHIEVQSMADIAYDTALNGQVIHGFGFIRVITKFPTPFSFNQEAFICAIDDPFSVYLGPHKNLEDLNDAFIVYDYTPEQYAEEFGGMKDEVDAETGRLVVGDDGRPAQVPVSAYAGLNDFTAIGNRARGWGDKYTIRVAEYYKRTWRTTEIWQLEGGNVVVADKVDKGLVPTLNIISSRQTEIPEVKWYKFNAVEILDETVVPSAYIPIVPVYGDRQIVDGQISLSGVVRDSKDAQKQYNYFRSKMTETVALAPTAPWIMAEGQDENHETEWDTANLENYSVLRYKPKSIGGHLAPPPQRQFASVDLSAFVVAGNQYENDIKATTQVYDPSLGARSNEVSGVAQRTRIAQGQTSNFTFTNNFSRSLRYLGMILLDIICGDGVTRKGIYDARTIARIIGDDNESKSVEVINDPNQPAFQEQPDETGNDIRRVYNLGIGTYDVAVGLGPSYLNKQQETFDMLAKVVNSYPEMMKFAGDIIMRNSGIPDADILAERVKRFIEITMPGIIQDDKEQAIPPKVQQAMKELMQQQEELMNQLQQAQQIIETKQIENSTKVQVEQIKQQGASQVEAMKVASAEVVASMNAQVKIAVESMKQAMADITARLSIVDTIAANLTKPGPVSSGAPA